MRQVLTTEIFHLIYKIEDRKWDELIEDLSEFDCSERDARDIADKVEWLKAQTCPDIVIEMTCQLIREVLALCERL